MDAATALADLSEISSQVEAAVAFDEDGAVVASTPGDGSRTERLARVGRELLEAAERIPAGQGRRLTGVEVALSTGSVFVARGRASGNGSSLVATTGPAPASRLVFHDLETCLRGVAEAGEQPAPKPRRAPRKKKAVDA